MHWQTHQFWTSNLIKSTMSADRFMQINKFIEIGEKNSLDKLHRIKWKSNHIQVVSNQIYSPNTNLCTDESMIGFKGRHSLKQCMPMKLKK